MLNAHYLEAFEKGKFCGGESRLAGYLGGAAPDELFAELPGKFAQSKYAYTVA